MRTHVERSGYAMVTMATMKITTNEREVLFENEAETIRSLDSRLPVSK